MEIFTRQMRQGIALKQELFLHKMIQPKLMKLLILFTQAVTMPAAKKLKVWQLLKWARVLVVVHIKLLLQVLQMARIKQLKQQQQQQMLQMERIKQLKQQQMLKMERVKQLKKQFHLQKRHQPNVLQ